MLISEKSMPLRFLQSIQTPEIHRHQFTDPRLLHRHTIDHIHGRHCLLVVGHDDELGVIRELTNHVGELTHVRIIQWRVHFVQNAKGRGLNQIDSKKEGRGS